MRCLYCGVELALLKKLAGSENFCSDAHRVAYQEEFSRLALNRLMQSQPPGPKKAGTNGSRQAVELDDITYPNLAAVQDTILEQHGVTRVNSSASRSSSLAVAEDADLQPLEMDLAKEPKEPSAAGFILEPGRIHVVRPKPLSSEEPLFRFSQYAMPALKAVIADETPLAAAQPAAKRRPKRISQQEAPAELDLMDELSFPIPLTLTPIKSGVPGPKWKQLPAIQFDIQGLEYINFLRTNAASKPAAEATDSSGEGNASFLANASPTPTRMDLLSDLRCAPLDLKLVEPTQPVLAAGVPELKFGVAEIHRPELDLATLHSAILIGPKEVGSKDVVSRKKPEAKPASQTPTLKKVPMTQEPPPTLPDILPKSKNVVEIKRQKSTLNQPSSPVAVNPATKPAEPAAPKSAGKLDGIKPPAPPSLEKPKAADQPKPAASKGGISKPGAVPHPEPIESPTKPPAILRPGPVVETPPPTDLGTDESTSNVFEMAGEIGPSPSFFQLLPMWVKILVGVAVLAAAAYVFSLLSASSKPRSAMQPPQGISTQNGRIVLTGVGYLGAKS